MTTRQIFWTNKFLRAAKNPKSIKRLDAIFGAAHKAHLLKIEIHIYEVDATFASSFLCRAYLIFFVGHQDQILRSILISNDDGAHLCSKIGACVVCVEKKYSTLF